jgi:hypothetical protein
MRSTPNPRTAPHRRAARPTRITHSHTPTLGIHSAACSCRVHGEPAAVPPVSDPHALQHDREAEIAAAHRACCRQCRNYNGHRHPCAVPELRHSVSLLLHGGFGSLRYIRALGTGGLALVMALMLAHALIFYRLRS